MNSSINSRCHSSKLFMVYSKMAYYTWIVYLCITLSVIGDLNLTEAMMPSFFPWVDEGRPIKSDILCPNVCKNEGREKDVRKCCTCNSRPVWEISQSHVLTPISFERYDIAGKIFIPTYHDMKNDTFLSFVKRSAFLTELPENLCEFSGNLVVIDVSLNELSEIGDVNCLWRLDTLILSHNKLTFISNITFHNMTNLRILDVSHNQIKSLDPGLFNDSAPNIYHADFSFNSFNKLDVSNVLFPNATLCTLNYSNSVVGEISNVLNVIGDEDVRLGSGTVILDNNILSKTHMNVYIWRTFINKDLKYVWKYNIEGTFTYNNVSIPCDCEVGELLTMVDFDDFFDFFNKNFSNLDAYVCESPESMKGINLTLVKELDLFDLFVCNESIYCPENCTCFEQPSQYRFVVNCSYQNHLKLPTRLPLSKYPYHLDFAHNQIKHLDTRPYISNVSHLFLGGNGILELDSSFVEALDDVELVTLNQHDLRSLPKNIVNIDASKFVFGKNSIPCDCSTEWLTRWRTYSKLNKTRNPLFCRNAVFGNKHAEEVFDYLQCSEQVVHHQIPILITFFVLISLSASLMVFFKNELLVLRSRLVKKVRKSKKTQFKYDVFISFDDHSSDLIRTFVVKFLRRYLVNEGYSVKIPCIDLSFGEPSEKETYEMMNITKSIIIIITKDYGEGEDGTWNALEYKHALHLYLYNAKNKIILVNFEGLRCSNTSLPCLKALCRVNGCLHVADRTRSIYSSITEKCGPPIANVQTENQNVRNKSLDLMSVQEL